MVMRVIIAALALITAWGGCRAIAQTPSDKARHEYLDLQERCGIQAEKVFRQYKLDDEKERKQNQLTMASADYQSHYNAALNRCFMAVKQVSDGGAVSKWLVDAYENREYASYFWMPDPKHVKKYWETPSCELTPSIREKRPCSSEDEYNEFVATYMEQ